VSKRNPIAATVRTSHWVSPNFVVGAKGVGLLLTETSEGVQRRAGSNHDSRHPPLV
jgi:hypothetical protein